MCLSSRKLAVKLKSISGERRTHTFALMLFQTLPDSVLGTLAFSSVPPTQWGAAAVRRRPGPLLLGQGTRSEGRQRDGEPGLRWVWNPQKAACDRPGPRVEIAAGDRGPQLLRIPDLEAWREEGTELSLLGNLGHKRQVSSTPPGRRLALLAARGCPGPWTQGAPEPWLHRRPAKAKSHTCGSKPKGQRARRWEEGLTGRCSGDAWELMPELGGRGIHTRNPG